MKKRAPVPPHPERDLLWFVANYAPEMESWERDIFLAVREESFYFYPVRDGRKFAPVRGGYAASDSDASPPNF